MNDHYQTLGVERAADAETIRRAYLKLMKRFHPDRLGPDAAGHARAREINLAFSILGNADSRDRYDRELLAAHEAELLRWQRREAARRRALVVQHRPPRTKGARLGRVLLALAVLGSVAFFYDQEAWRPIVPLTLEAMSGIADDDEGSAEDPPLPPVDARVVEASVADYQWVARNSGISGLSSHADQCWQSFQRSPSISLLDGCAAFEIAADFFVRGVAERTGRPPTAHFDAVAREQRFDDGLARIGAAGRQRPRLSEIEGATITAMVDGLGAGTGAEPVPSAVADQF